jgi:hypothetical protein
LDDAILIPTYYEGNLDHLSERKKKVPLETVKLISENINVFIHSKILK